MHNFFAIPVSLTTIIRHFLLAFLVIAWAASCTVLQHGSPDIVTIEDSPVSTEEFLYVYNKNNLNTGPVDSTEIRDYLDLFINFKLKVREAEALGLDDDSTFIQELEGYRRQLATPYLTETKLLDSLANITYERLKTEVNASHILIQVPENATPEDTLSAYRKCMEVRERIIKGEDFNQVAQQESQDPSARENKGNLGYFTAMQMVYPFEDAAYRLPVDSVSYPIRTSFGYHLIEVHDKRPSQGRVQVSHILVRAPAGMSHSDSLLSANRAREIYVKAINQEDWDLLCRQFSEDSGTKMKGGKLPWFKTGDISNIPSFEETAFNLKTIGEISKPVKTAYGWHIIRLEGKQDLESFETLEPKIRANISANSRAELNQQELIKRLKKENQFKENRQIVEEALSYANDSLRQGTWHASENWEISNKTVFSIGDSVYSAAGFYRYVENNQPFKDQQDPVAIMRSAYQDYSKKALIDYEDAHLADKYYDYKMLLQEYRDGILLFQLMEEKVWNQAIQDTVGLSRFFEENRQQYQWDTRAAANIYNVQDEKALVQVKDFIAKGYFSYPKYDFYSEQESFNKAQVRILNDVSQQLLQNDNRYLVLSYDTQNPKLHEIRDKIIENLFTNGIDTARSVTRQTEQGTLGFILYVASPEVKDLVENMNQTDPLTIQFENGFFQPGENELVERLNWETGMEVFEVDNRLVLVEITEILPPGNQQLEEIKGQVISDYQTQLEQEWVQALRNKYLVEIHEKELAKVYEKYSN